MQNEFDFDKINDVLVKRGRSIASKSLEEWKILYENLPDTDDKDAIASSILGISVMCLAGEFIGLYEKQFHERAKSCLIDMIQDVELDDEE